MTVEEKLREWLKENVPFNSARSESYAIEHKKLERLLRSVDERAFGAGMCHRTPLEGQSTPIKRILKALEETEA